MTPNHTKTHGDTSPPRLTLEFREWLVTLLLVLVIVMFTPSIWKIFENYATPPDYRVPYALSKDYGLYERAMDRLQPAQIPVLGDSVVWGEYVSRDGTLSHFLNHLSDLTPNSLPLCLRRFFIVFSDIRDVILLLVTANSRWNPRPWSHLRLTFSSFRSWFRSMFNSSGEETILSFLCV